MVYFGPNFFLQLVNDGVGVRILSAIVPIGDLGSFWQYDLGVDESTAFMSLSHKVTASSSSSSCVIMFVSILLRLSFSVLCNKSSSVLSNR